ncbi:MAG TPA: alpha-1,2-fucosyltransferase [Myxococcota bacterium]|nr:alpha-1,2-fucosyltransferase [Myxococcota bacterium]
MIVTRISGGLGNQMFQYAAGRRLALARATGLLLDLSPLDDPRVATPRCYELHAFPIRAAIASAAELEAIAPRRDSLAARIARRACGARRSAATERHFHFDPEVLDLPDGSCLHGYWQSERYFADVADDVRRELTVERPATGRNAELLERIDACNAVSVHVRRGDYVSLPPVRATHGVCPLDYYERAARTLAERVADPVFFVFSDDPDWVRDHLRLDGEMVQVDHNRPEAGSEDMRLMSRCAHHVIANSTFSWWGAWLDPRPEKIVVAPRRWFEDGDRDTSDLVPAGWIRL